MEVCEVWLARDFLARAGRPVDIPPCDHPTTHCPPVKTDTKEPPMTTAPTPQQVLDLALPPNDSGASTVRGYLAALAGALWNDASSKRPFGNSDWHNDLYEAFANQGWITAEYAEYDGERWMDSCDTRAGDRLVRDAIKALGEPAAS